MRWRGWKRALASLALLVLAGLAGGLAYAPYVYAELMGWIEPHDIVDPAPPVLAKGRMIDDYWSVEEIAPDTFAIGEPRPTSGWITSAPSPTR